MLPLSVLHVFAWTHRFKHNLSPSLACSIISIYHQLEPLTTLCHTRGPIFAVDWDRLCFLNDERATRKKDILGFGLGCWN
jgi:hypothetical protein